ncbi:unnamed protein product [Polarella glacialis]|uniref:Uncharacterized protein n=1 Tax=Polarella glacialis TaxID=89957 RepID=A0A813IKB8_POLGL|nr:unnamed protein product [Polarella glacialis]
MSLACGKDHMLLLDQFGHAWALGNARAAGIGLPSSGEIVPEIPAVIEGPLRSHLLTQPTPVTMLWSVHLAKVACGNGHTIAMVAGSGAVFAWGRVLAQPPFSDSGGWRLPGSSSCIAGEALDVAAGDGHLAIACLKGYTYAWGENHHGQCARDPVALGNRGGGTSLAGNRLWSRSIRESGGQVRRMQEEGPVDEEETPDLVSAPARAGFGLRGAVARRVACGRYHTAVLCASGHVYTFGDSFSGQLGRASSPGGSWKPGRLLLSPLDAGNHAAGNRVLVVQIACGDEHTLCLTDSGRVLAFGSGEHGQLGLGGVRSHRTPVLVRPLTGVCEVVAGAHWTLFRCYGGKVFLAGKTVAPRAPGASDEERDEQAASGAYCDHNSDHRLLRQIVVPP